MSVFFDLDGKHLWFASYGRSPRLARIELQSGARSEVALPPLEKDAVAYIAQNPANAREYAIATFERSVFVTKDGGKSWSPIAERGRGR